MAASKPPAGPNNLTEEVQTLAKDVARDALHAARISLKIAERVGRESFDLLEKTADKVLKDRK